MSYHQKVIFSAIGLLLFVTLMSYLGELASSRPDYLGVGLVSLVFSIVEASVLLLLAIIFWLGGFGKDDTELVAAPKDLLDSGPTTHRRLTSRRKAGAFFAAAGLVLLIGGSLCFGSLSVGTFSIH